MIFKIKNRTKIIFRKNRNRFYFVLFPTIMITIKLLDICYDGIRIIFIFLNFDISLTVLFKSWEEKVNDI